MHDHTKPGSVYLIDRRLRPELAPLADQDAAANISPSAENSSQPSAFSNQLQT
jgi:hypothetical protein